MRYEDASHTSAFQGSQPIANDDLDSLPAGSKSPATGNLITGEGTQTGSAGADVAPGAHVAAIAGKGGEDTSFSGGKLAVSGEHGKLSVDADGNYIYQANAGVENVRDRFTYTLADNSGATDTGALIVEIGKTPVVIKADAQQIVPGPDGVVTLPPGVELSDIRVVGRNLVIDMPDGTQLIIIDGAIFVPQLVLNGVEIPSSNLAALLIGQEPQPAAGEAPQSGGGNFDVPVPPLDPPVPLGDLIPPTEYVYQPPEPQPPLLPLEDDEEPSIVIQPDGQPASVNAVDSVDEDGLPARDGDLPDEPEGSDEGADGNPSNNSDTDETTAGTIIIDSPDGVESVTINGVLITGVIGQVIPGEFGLLTITGFNGDDILYSYTLTDNTSGDDTHDDFSVVLTDEDGDQATATLTIDIIDDVPTARNDTDAVIKGDTSTDGNVMTGVGTTSAPGGVDTVGADDAEVTGVHAGTSGSFTGVPDGGVLIVGQFGDLTLFPDGSYTYTLHADVGDGGNDVFTYQLTDGDGDTSDATLTITVPPDLKPVVGPNPTVLLDDDALAGGNPGGTGDDPDAANVSGQLSGSGGDAPLTFSVQLTGAPAGFTYVSGGAGIVLIQQGGVTVLTVTVDSDGSYSVVQNAPIDHAAGGDENNQSFTINYTVTDVDGDSANGTLNINVDDDTPVADPESFVGGLVDEDDLPAGNNDNAAGDDDPGNADGDNDGTTTGGAAGSLAALFSVGADAPLQNFGLSTDTSGLPALTSNGVAVTYLVVGDTLTASAGGSTVFTLTVNADGSWVFDLEGQLDHPVADTEDNLLLDLSSIITAEDADGDPVTAADGTFVITVDDDMPVASQGEIVGQVDEDALADGNNDSAPGDDPGGTTASGAAGSLTGLFNIGADQPGTIGLLTDTSGLPALTSNGVAVTYAVVGDTLTASAGATDVFTLTVNADGSWEFELLDQLDHPVVDTEDNLLLDFSSIIGAEDADGDTSDPLPEGSFVIDVDDDMPVAFDPDPITTGVENMAGETATADLDTDGNIDDNVGADQPGIVRFANITDGDDSGFTSGEDPIEYWLSNDGQTLQGRINSTDGTDGTLIFQIELNQDQGPGDDTYTITMFGTIDNGAGVTFDDLTSTAAGNVSFRGVGADDAGTTVDLLLSAGPGAGVTVNTDSDSIGAANQSMDVGETIRIDFVTNLTEDTADADTPPSGFNYGAHVSTNSFIGLIPQVQGSQTETVAFTVFALDSANTDTTEPDRNPAGGFTDATITAITEVTVDGFDVGETPLTVDVTGFAVGVFTAVAYGISVRVNADGSVTFSGIQEGDSYGFSTVGEGDFNAVVVQSEAAGTGGSSEDSFDLGVFSIGIVDTGDPIDLSYDLELTDADGDSVLVTDALQITIAPDTSESLVVPFAAESSESTSSFSLLASDSQEQQLQKTAANSNTLTLAAAVAAAGMVETQAAAAPAHDNGKHGPQVEESSSGHQFKAIVSSENDSSSSAVSNEAPEAANDSAPVESSSHSSDPAESDHVLDDSAAKADAQSSDVPVANDQGPASSSVEASPAALAVGMPSAEALQAAGVAGNAQHGGSVEQIVAEALGQGNATDPVDALLNALPGGNGAVGALANLASPAANAVPGGDMLGLGAFAPGHDMMMNLHAAMHHDAVQPVANG